MRNLLGRPSASHFAQWEMQRHLLHRLSLEWLDHTTVDGQASGLFYGDEAGRLRTAERVPL